jgi:hypothetical protein
MPTWRCLRCLRCQHGDRLDAGYALNYDRQVCTELCDQEENVKTAERLVRAAQVAAQLHQASVGEGSGSTQLSHGSSSTSSVCTLAQE